MIDFDSTRRPVLAWIQRNLTFLVLGLLIILVPISLTSKSIDHALKTVRDVIKKLDPGVDFLERTDATIAIVAAIVLFFWGLGWFLSRTETGGRWLDWANSKYLKRSPLWVKRSKRAQEHGEAAQPGAQPTLARIQGTWQPGVIVETDAGGWCTVFVPQAPALSTGQVYCVPPEETIPLDTPLEEFRKRLTASGGGSADWLRALAAT